ncbi:PAS domain-containing protein [Muricauda sp. 2012CJ35-5]|uniref:histidine kinase n=1 Tax=Flagellimonas spongiicola TaxID=2942208 RepID=A0ABT0PUS3_9FLAO|nr:HAMP domain-containing sensor histidine kinase [Allomuricauda spongiicola]MCL6274198.1 PAS domain-containing protein [Allomuricauda spongiicola]
MKGTKEAIDTILQLPFPIVLVNKEMEIQKHSNGFYSFFGLDTSDTYPKKLETVIGELPKSLKKIRDGKTHQKKQISEFITHITRKNELKWFKLVLNIVEDSSGYYIYFDDVTQKKIALDLSQRAERTARIGSWEVDLVNNTIFWSEMTKEIHEVPKDFSPDLETGINFYKEGEHRDKIVEVVSEAIENGTPYDVELIIVTAKGNEKWVRAIGEADLVNGKVTRLFGVFKDIDKSKKESQEIQILTHRMKVAVESSNIGIWDYDIIKNNLVWDENMYSLYDVNKENFIGEVAAWEQTIHPNDKERSLKAVELAVQGKKEFNTEFRIITGNGAIKYIHGQGIVFRDKEGNPLRMIGANMDVTRIKRADNRLRQLLNTTEKQNKSLLNFAHIVSHNLRSHSSNLSMLTGMLLDKTDPAKQERFIEMIRTSSERLDETVVQLNEVIKIQTNQDQKMNWVSIEETLESVFESINALIGEIVPKIELKIPKGLKVFAIQPYLTSIFLNLLTNSLKYRSPNKKLKLVIKAEKHQNTIKISFQDNGRGINLERHGHTLFGMYKTFHGNPDAKGVGLFITKNQMDAMNAEISVESEEGKGAKFTLTFTNHKNLNN